MNADPECSGCSSVRSCHSATAENTLQFVNVEDLVPGTRPGPLDREQNSGNSTGFEQTQRDAAKVRREELE